MLDPSENSALTDLLRRRFAQHNWHALFMAGLSLVAATILWALLYAITAWLTLLFRTIVIGLHGPGRDPDLPRSFNAVFGAIAVLLIVAAALRRAWTPNDLPPNRRSIGEHATDLLLAVPAITVAIWSNLAAGQWLSPLQYRQAARLLLAVLVEKRVPLTSIPVVIPHEASREKVIFGLLLIGVLEMGHEESGAHLRLTRDADRNLLVPEASALNEGPR